MGHLRPLHSHRYPSSSMSRGYLDSLANDTHIVGSQDWYGGIPQGHWCYLRLGTKMLARRENPVKPNFFATRFSRNK
jgi:hypothetical protein